MATLKVDKIITVKNVFDFNDLHMECGIIKDEKHFQPSNSKNRKLGTSTVRGKSNKQSKLSIVAICEKIDKQFGILSDPELLHSQTFIDKIMQSLIGDFLFDNSKKNIALNGWRAFFRQPMMSGKYKNNPQTVKIKGFNKGGIDTGQLYENINSLIVKDNKIWSLKG